MNKKLKFDLTLVLPDIPDERVTCVGRLTELLQVEGMECAHNKWLMGFSKSCARGWMSGVQCAAYGKDVPSSALSCLKCEQSVRKNSL